MTTAVPVIKSCPACGSKAIQKVRREWRDEAGGKTYVVPKLEFYECPDCGEKMYPPEAMRRIEATYPLPRARRKMGA